MKHVLQGITIIVICAFLAAAGLFFLRNNSGIIPGSPPRSSVSAVDDTIRTIHFSAREIQKKKPAKNNEPSKKPAPFVSDSAIFPVRIRNIQCKVGETNTIFVMFSLNVKVATLEEKKRLLRHRDVIRGCAYKKMSHICAREFSLHKAEAILAGIVDSLLPASDISRVECSHSIVSRSPHTF